MAGRRVILLAIGLAACAALSLGCTSTPPAAVELNAKDSGSTQQLAIGQELVITLTSNPTTGYRWAVDGTLPEQLEQVGESTYSSESTLAGAGGQEVWTFRGVQPGSAELRLKYWRSFEPTAQPPETFAVTVDVK